MKKKSIFVVLGAATFALGLASCNGENEATNINPNTTTIIDDGEEKSSAKAKDASDNYVEITEAFTLTTEDGAYNTTTDSNGTTIYTISQSGTYILKGLLENGQIVVSGDDIDCDMELHGAKITNSYNSPIYVMNAASAKVKIMEDTYNEIIDERAAKSQDIESQGEAAIYAKSDLKISGRGSLVVSGGYNNGISTTDDLVIKNVILKATARNNTLKGNDSVTIESGQIIAISTGGDGIKTDNSDLSSKGNQHGSVHILGGVIEVYSACDGIDSAYDATVASGATLSIHTDKYSDYSGTVSTVTSDVYIKSSYDNSTYRYAVYLYNDDEDDGVWADAEYYTSQKGFGRDATTSYFYKFSMPSGYSNVKLCMFNVEDLEDDFDDCYALSSGQTINTLKDLMDIKSISNNEIIFDWNTYTYSNNPNGNNPFDGTMTNTSSKSEYSSKGIKASNEIIIYGGTITIEAGDDAIHANGDNLIESTSEYGKGDITVNGGYLTLTSADDAMHADNILTINAGTISVVTSYEGIEGNLVNFNGGTTIVYATDDGINAASGTYTPYVNVTGGTLDVTVGSGDTDGIDSNGNYTQSGGYVITRCQAQDMGGASAALDIDGECVITGGTFIAAGGVAETPTEDSQNWVIFGSTTSSSMEPGAMGGMGQNASIQAGSYSISGTTISFTLDQGYCGLWISSSELTTGTSYTLNGTTSYTWTQESGKSQVE